MNHDRDVLRDLEHEVGVMIRRIRRVLTLRARLLDPDLPVGAYLVLSHIAAHDAVRSSDIVAEVGLDKGTVSRHLAHLVERGLVERHADPDDRRATLLRVSAATSRRLAEISAERLELLDERLGDWSHEDLTAFVQMLGRYNETLG